MNILPNMDHAVPSSWANDMMSWDYGLHWWPSGENKDNMLFKSYVFGTQLMSPTQQVLTV